MESIQKVSDSEALKLSQDGFNEIADLAGENEISIDELQGVTPDTLARFKEYLKTKDRTGIKKETLEGLEGLVARVGASAPVITLSTPQISSESYRPSIDTPRTDIMDGSMESVSENRKPTLSAIYSAAKIVESNQMIWLEKSKSQIDEAALRWFSDENEYENDLRWISDFLPKTAGNTVHLSRTNNMKVLTTLLTEADKNSGDQAKLSRIYADIKKMSDAMEEESKQYLVVGMLDGAYSLIPAKSVVVGVISVGVALRYWMKKKPESQVAKVASAKYEGFFKTLASSGWNAAIGKEYFSYDPKSEFWQTWDEIVRDEIRKADPAISTDKVEEELKRRRQKLTTSLKIDVLDPAKIEELKGAERNRQLRELGKVTHGVQETVPERILSAVNHFPSTRNEHVQKGRSVADIMKSGFNVESIPVGSETFGVKPDTMKKIREIEGFVSQVDKYQKDITKVKEEQTKMKEKKEKLEAELKDVNKITSLKAQLTDAETRLSSAESALATEIGNHQKVLDTAKKPVVEPVSLQKARTKFDAVEREITDFTKQINALKEKYNFNPRTVAEITADIGTINPDTAKVNGKTEAELKTAISEIVGGNGSIVEEVGNKTYETKNNTRGINTVLAELHAIDPNVPKEYKSGENRVGGDKVNKVSELYDALVKALGKRMAK